jgi:hypothetical protein
VLCSEKVILFTVTAMRTPVPTSGHEDLIGYSEIDKKA